MSLKIEPWDQYNQQLVNEVHPPEWENPDPLKEYHLVVLGAGPAGLVVAAGASSLGAKVALVEKNLMGGDCLNVGCVPSKSLIRSGRAAYALKEAHEMGLEDVKGQVNFEKVMERLRYIRSSIAHHDSARRFSEMGIHVFIGEGKFLDGRRIEVAGKELRFRKAVVATGARAFFPPIPGLEEVGFLTNENLFSLTQLPRKLLVIGGGPIGCEISQSFQRLGSEVTIVEMMDQFLIREDKDAAQILKDQLLEEGVKIFLSSTVGRVEKMGDQKKAYIQTPQEEIEWQGDAILIGAGRVPNVDGIGLEKAGVEYDKRKGLLVQETLVTTNPRIYGAGDVCLPYKFTHTADFTARIVLENALFGRKKKWTDLQIPWCTYTDPEIAHIGIYEHEAKKKGIPIDTYKKDFNEIDRSIIEGHKGFIKVHTQKGKDKILGATIVAPHAGEMIGEIALAMKYNIGLAKISQVIHPYPTEAEGIRSVGDLYNKTRLTPFVQKLLKWLIWWRC